MLKSKFYLNSSPIIAILIVAVIIGSMFIPAVAAFADDTVTVVTYDANGGTVVSGSTTQTLPLNSSAGALTPPTVTREGYSLYGWSVTRDTYTAIGQYVSNNNPTLYAWWVEEHIYITITFNPNGGTLVGESTLTAEYGDDFSTYTKPTATRDGYTFLGWGLSPTTLGSFGSVPSTDQTLYAVWQEDTPTTVTLTFNANGGTLSGISTVTATIGDSFSSVSKPTATRVGYTFLGWSTNSSTLTTITTVPDENDTLYAIWQYVTVDDVTVTFNANGGTLTGDTSVLVAPSTAFSSVTKPTATRDGYTFAGWSTNSNLLVSLATVPSTNITVYAYWVADAVVGVDYSNTNTIALSYGAYVYIISDSTVTTSSTIVFNSYSCSAYNGSTWVTFTGFSYISVYNDPLDGSFKVRFNAGSSTYTQVKDFVLNYTVENPVTITYNSNGGFIASGDSTQTAVIGADVSTLTPPTVTRDGYTCIGWSTSSTTLTTISIIPETDTTLYAIWQYTATEPITVTYNPNGGIVVTGETSQTAYSYNSYATLTPPTVVKDGFKFYGWSVTVDTYTAIGQYLPTSDVTLYAYWVEYCTVSYELNGGTLVDGDLTEYVPVNTSYGDLNYPEISREGYRFIGWSNYPTSYSRLGQAPDTTVRSSKTIYAFWLANDAAPVAITFNLNGGTLVDGDTAITVPCGSFWSAVTETPTVEKVGYTFVGWSRSTQSLVEPSVTEFYDTTTLYAWYERNETIIVSNDVNTDKIEIPYRLINDMPDYAELCKTYDIPETAFIAEIEIATKPIISKDVAIYLGLVSDSNTKITMNEAVLLSLGLVDNEDIDTSETGKKLALLSYAVDYEIFDFDNMLVDSVLNDITTDCRIFLILRPKAFNTQYVVEKIMIIGTDTTMTAVFAEDTVMKDELAKMELTYGDQLVYGIDNSAQSQNVVINWVSDTLNISAFWSNVVFYAAIVVLAFILILIIRGIIINRPARHSSRRYRRR